MSSGLFKNCYLQTIHLQIIYLVYMYKQDLVSNNLHGLICHKTQLTKQPFISSIEEFFYYYYKQLWSKSFLLA